MGSPFTARLCRLVADRIAPGAAVADRVLGWQGDPGNRADALPLRLCGALHGLVIGGRDAGLTSVYPPRDRAADDAAIWAAVSAASVGHAAAILERLDHPPQTNEPQRCAALAPGLLTVAQRFGLPLVTSEIGASAGLNLVWDRFAYALGGAPWGDTASPVGIAPEWDGPPPPVPSAVVFARAGCDHAPLDPALHRDRLHLLSFVWADQAERLARTGAAINLARDAGVKVARADAADWLKSRLVDRHPGCVHVVYHSIVWQYLDPARRDRISALLVEAGSRADHHAPLAWLRLESDGAEPGAAITLTIWPGAEERMLGRADYHGRWVHWRGWD